MWKHLIASVLDMSEKEVEFVEELEERFPGTIKKVMDSRTMKYRMEDFVTYAYIEAQNKITEDAVEFPERLKAVFSNTTIGYKDNTLWYDTEVADPFDWFREVITDYMLGEVELVYVVRTIVDHIERSVELAKIAKQVRTNLMFIEGKITKGIKDSEMDDMIESLKIINKRL